MLFSNKLKITTFVEKPEHVKLLVKNGVNNIIVEDPSCSILFRGNSYQFDVNYNRLKNIIDEFNIECNHNNIIFNYDIIAHNMDIYKLDEIISFLYKYNISKIRVMDIGVVNHIIKYFPEMKIQLNTETGNNNYRSVLFYDTTLKDNLDVIVLSKELDIESINNILQKTNVKTELQAHGWIMLMYTLRQVLSGLKTFKNNRNLYVELIENKRQNESFPLIENQHGSFLLHSKHICLLEELPKIINAGINSILIDLRSYPIDILSETIKIYKQAIDEYYKKGKILLYYNKLAEITNMNLFKGFFLQNNTDKKSTKKLTNNFNLKEDHKYIGIVKDCIKGETITIKFSDIVEVNDTIIINTPEDKLINIKIYFIKDIYKNDVTKTQPGKYYTINWKKGVVNKSNVFIKTSY